MSCPARRTKSPFIPAQAGIQSAWLWVSAFAGTNGTNVRSVIDMSALHQVDVFDRDRTAVAIVDDENGKPDGCLRRSDG